MTSERFLELPWNGFVQPEDVLGLVEAIGVLVGHLEEDLLGPFDVVFVVHVDVEIETPLGGDGQVGELSLEEHLVGQTDQQVVERPQLDGKQVD